MGMSNLNSIKTQLKGKVQEVVVQRERRLIVRTVREHLKETMKALIALEGFTHLSTITTVDFGSEIEVIYHIACEDMLISLKVQVSKENPTLTTIVDLIPGAVLYEREVHDLFGVKFEGNPDLSPLLLPDNWPDDVYPLRKEWTLGRISEKMRG